jgi:hypothetical protein
MKMSLSKPSVRTNRSMAEISASILAFLVLLVLLVTRNTQNMGDRMFWLNEVYDLLALNRSFWEISKLTIKGLYTQPPLFYWIAYFVSKIGIDPLILRSIPLAFYVAMIGFAIFAVREFGLGARVFLSFVLIMSPFGAFVATEFRPYALAAFSILASSVLFYRAVRDPLRWSSVISYALAALILQYSLTLNCLTFGLQMLFLSGAIVFFGYKEGLKRTLARYKPLLIVSIPLCIAYAFFLNAVLQAGQDLRPALQFHLFSFIKALLQNAIVMKKEIIFLHSWALSFGPACLLLGCVLGLRRQRWAAVYLMLLFAGQWIFSTFMTFSRIDYPAPQRYFVASYVAFALLAAIGVEDIFQHLSRKTKILLICFLLVTTLPGGIIRYVASLKTPGFNPITEAVEAMRCTNHPTVILCDPWRDVFVPWYAYRNDPLIIAPHRVTDPYIKNPAEAISRAASKKSCFILIEGPQGNVYKGETYKILSALPNYTQKKYSITPGHVVPNSAWLFTPLE